MMSAKEGKDNSYITEKMRRQTIYLNGQHSLGPAAP
jgi:hypothetical protein